MENRQPRSTRQLDQRARRVAALGAAVDLDRRVVLGAGLEDRLGVELRLRPRAASAGDQPAGAVAEHVGAGVADRLDHPPGHRRRVHPQLGVHAARRRRRAGRAARRSGRAPVVEDVDLDPLEQPEAPPRCSLTASTTSSCLVSRSTDRPLATVRRGEWSVSTRYSWPSSIAVSAISSIGEPPSDQSECEWQVALERGPGSRHRRRPAAAGSALELGQVAPASTRRRRRRSRPPSTCRSRTAA